jgi:hypothetical protein
VEAAATICDETSLRFSISLHRDALDQAPADREILTALANQLILLGSAHTPSRGQKRKLFAEAMKLCERAMHLNPHYDAARKAGLEPWEATDRLQADDREAALFWATAVLYTFREGLTLPGKVLHARWLHRADLFLERIETIEPLWHGGAAPFSRAIVHMALPASAGGDKSRVRPWLEQALAASDHWMLPRWGKATYFAQWYESPDSPRKDLERVIRMDPDAGGEAPYWRRHFQKLATEALNHENHPAHE